MKINREDRIPVAVRIDDFVLPAGSSFGELVDMIELSDVVIRSYKSFSNQLFETLMNERQAHKDALQQRSMSISVELKVS